MTHRDPDAVAKAAREDREKKPHRVMMSDGTYAQAPTPIAKTVESILDRLDKIEAVIARNMPDVLPPKHGNWAVSMDRERGLNLLAELEDVKRERDQAIAERNEAQDALVGIKYAIKMMDEQKQKRAPISSYEIGGANRSYDDDLGKR